MPTAEQGRRMLEDERSTLTKENADLLLSAILDTAQDAIISVTSDLHICMFNKGAERVFGIEAEEALGLPLDVLIPEETRGRHVKHIAKFAQSTENNRLMKSRSEIEGRRMDGTRFPAEASISQQVIGGDIFFTAILRDITARKKKEEELALALIKSRESNQAKIEFLSNISHELRTPLISIIGFSDLLDQGAFGPIEVAQYKDFIHHIHNDGVHLLTLVEDILNLSSYDTTDVTLNRDTLVIPEVIAAAKHAISEQAKKAGIVVSVRLGTDLPMLFADKNALELIVTQMLSNAIKFTPRGGEVSIFAEIDERGCLHFGVTDTGIGIAPEDMPKATDLFSQVDGSSSRQFGGTGIGLSLIKLFAERHKATFELKSEQGVGTTVVVCFPPELVINDDWQIVCPGS